MKKGLFITFEGGDGAGKSTQLLMLSDYMSDKYPDRDVIVTRQPGGTDTANEIRKILVEGEADKCDHMTETLLHLAARSDHVVKVIRPALDNGNIVICDRFTDSTVAYQGYGHGLDMQIIEKLHELTIGDLQPDLTFILDIPAEIGLQRTQQRTSAEDRYEKMDIEFHHRLRNGFLKIAEQNPHRCKVIDAQQPVEMICQEIKEILGAVVKL